MMGGGWWGGVGAWHGVLFWGVIVVMLLVLAGFLAAPIRSRDRARRHEPDAQELLRRRYARGEIDRAEYRRKRADLDES